MLEVKEIPMKQSKLLCGIMLVALLLLAPTLASVKTTGQEEAAVSKDKWEYLVVASPSRTNFSPTGNPRMRKEAMGGFGIEAFVLEQHLDRLGAKGWELVSVTGPASDPVYYFKRRK
jgi:hypothetical protein